MQRGSFDVICIDSTHNTAYGVHGVNDKCELRWMKHLASASSSNHCCAGFLYTLVTRDHLTGRGQPLAWMLTSSDA